MAGDHDRLSTCFVEKDVITEVWATLTTCMVSKGLEPPCPRLKAARTQFGFPCGHLLDRILCLLPLQGWVGGRRMRRWLSRSELVFLWMYLRQLLFLLFHDGDEYLKSLRSGTSRELC